MGCRPDVGQRNDNFPGSGGRRNNPDSFAREREFAGATMARIEQNRWPAARCFEVGDHLGMASDPKIAVNRNRNQGIIKEESRLTGEELQVRLILAGINLRVASGTSLIGCQKNANQHKANRPNPGYNALRSILRRQPQFQPP
jgi:hypothetical protein